MTDDLWYPAAIRDPAPSYGTHADQGEPKFLLHTTEGPPGLYAPDPSRGIGRRYYGNLGTWPTFTVARPLAGWAVYQHIPANRSAMSLRNLPGGVETNRDNVIQVEIAWKAAEIRQLPAEAMDELARLLAWAHQVRGVPIRSTVKWVPYPASYGERAAQRLSGPEWDVYSGVCGHMHAAENDHGDPGNIDIVTLLQAAAWYADPEDDMPSPREWTEEDWAAFRRHAGQGVHDLLWGQMQNRPEGAHDSWHPPREAGVGAVVRRNYEMTGAAWRDLGRLRDEMAAGGAVAAPPTRDTIMAGLDEVRDPADLVEIAGRASALAHARMTVPVASPPQEVPDAS